MPSLRITQGIQYLQTLSSLQRNYARLFDTQAALASGKRIRTPSDDPTGAAQVLEYARRAADLAQYRSNLSAGRSALDSAAAELQGIADAFPGVRERVIQAVSGTLGDADRLTIADELDQHLVGLMVHLNAQEGGRFTFAGSRTDAAPFFRSTGPDGLERIVYAGDGLVNQVGVGPSLTEAGNIPGSRLIDVGPRGPTVFRGTTGAQPGAGNDSGVGRARLLVSHTLTLFGTAPGAAVDAASGLRAGASSAALDTILGTGHTVKLVVNAGATAGSVSLDDGPTVTFGAGVNDLAVTNAAGDVVHLDLSQLAGGFAGTVALDARGALSLDGGQSTVPIDFTATGQNVIAADGTVTHVNTTGIVRTGAEDVTYGGTLDLFNAVLSIRDLLRTTGSKDDVTAALERARDLLDDLDGGEEAILRSLAEAGSASSRLSSLDERLADLEVTVADRRSKVEDADLAQLLTTMQSQESVYQTSLLVTARLSQLSLARFLG